jgi:hypothetical protein
MQNHIDVLQITQSPLFPLPPSFQDEFSWGMTRQVDAKKKSSLGDKTDVTEEGTNSTLNDGTDLELNDKQYGTEKSASANHAFCERKSKLDETKNPKIAPEEQTVHSDNFFCATDKSKPEDAGYSSGGRKVLNLAETTDLTTVAMETQPCSSMAPTSVTEEAANDFEQIQLEI